MLRIAKDCKNIDKGMVNPCLPLDKQKEFTCKKSEKHNCKGEEQACVAKQLLMCT